MKKFVLVLIALFSFSQFAYADTISYDKSDFAKVYTVIDDAVYDIRIIHQTILRATKLTVIRLPLHI